MVDEIEAEHRAIRALAAKRVRTEPLALTVERASRRFKTTAATLASLLATGELRAVRVRGKLEIPIWRLDRLFPRRSR